MRLSSYLALTGILLFSVPAMAGNVTSNNGQFVWQPAQCQAPAVPPSLQAANSETAADDMNKLVTEYNQYTLVMQTYLDCVSKEAQSDSSAIGQSITRSAQTMIDEAHKNMAQLGAPLKQAQQ
ncbi:MAG: hypothetical protein SFW62_10310 [Alphaproteobacteria bacterium]|nr:hypothetical protein [Alphaproteobacteria bacterium]